MYLVYILQSQKNGRYYVGSTSNLPQRVRYHNEGRVLSTKAFTPWRVIYSERFATKSEASTREFRIKSWKKRTAIEKLINK